MSYDVLAICQVATLRPLLSVRLVQHCAKLTTAEDKLSQMRRMVENSTIRGQESFVIAPHGIYRQGELWKGATETMDDRRQASVVSAAIALVKTFRKFPVPRTQLERDLWKAVDVLQEAERRTGAKE